jgi:predicted enzyme related to lactoylglutathione lyase
MVTYSAMTRSSRQARTRPPWSSTSLKQRQLSAASSQLSPLNTTDPIRNRLSSGMAVSLHHVVIDAHDLPALARFWAQVLGWRILSEREREIVIGADATAPMGICFMPVSDVKTTKNRLHLDLSPDPGEQEAEIERILALGARRVEIGQTGAESWTVLADPEGNEFCVVRPKRTLID